MAVGGTVRVDQPYFFSSLACYLSGEAEECFYSFKGLGPQLYVFLFANIK